MLKQERSQFEFIALMASLMAMAALSIDALLPAMSVIGDVVGVTDAHDNQLLITMIFLGLGIGQLVLGENQWCILDLWFLLQRVLFVFLLQVWKC